MSKQRKALAQGVKNMVMNNIRENMASIDDKDILDVLLITQYYDMIETMSSSPDDEKHSLILPLEPTWVQNVREQLSKFAECKIPDLLAL